MSITGDFRELNAAAVTIRALEGMPQLMAEIGAEKIAGVIDQQFESGVDPYGDPWADLVIGGPSHLQDTEGMRRSVQVSASNGSIQVFIDDPSGFHQTGTVNMVDRPILPSDAGDMPPGYELALLQAAREAGLEPG